MARWIDRLIRAGTAPAAPQAQGEGIPTVHEAASTGRRLRLWRPFDTSPRFEHQRRWRMGLCMGWRIVQRFVQCLIHNAEPPPD